MTDPILPCSAESVGLPPWHPVWDTLRAIICAALVIVGGIEIYEDGGAWAVMLAIVVIGGMAS